MFNIVAQLSEIGIVFFSGKSQYILLLKSLAVISFSAGPILSILFAKCFFIFVKKRKKSHKIYFVCGFESIFIILTVLSFFNDVFFSFDSQGALLNGPLTFLSNGNEVFILLFHLALIIFYHSLFSFPEFL